MTSQPAPGPAWWEDDPPPSAWPCHDARVWAPYDTAAWAVELARHDRARTIPPDLVAAWLAVPPPTRAVILGHLARGGATRTEAYLRHAAERAVAQPYEDARAYLADPGVGLRAAS